MRLALLCGGCSSIARGRQITPPAHPDSYFVRKCIYLRHSGQDGTVATTISSLFHRNGAFPIPLRLFSKIVWHLPTPVLHNSILCSMTVSGKLVRHQAQDGKCRYERNCKIECAKAISSVVCATERLRIRGCLEHCTCMAVDGA